MRQLQAEGNFFFFFLPRRRSRSRIAGKSDSGWQLGGILPGRTTDADCICFWRWCQMLPGSSKAGRVYEPGGMSNVPERVFGEAWGVLAEAARDGESTRSPNPALAVQSVPEDHLGATEL